MNNRTSQILYRYWNEVRNGRLAPARLEIEPARITDILSETFILETGEIGGYTFRLAGTRICEQMGTELRGREFLDIAGEENAPILDDVLATVTEKGAVATFMVEMQADDGRTVEFEILLLPLMHTRQTISRYLGCMTAIDPPVWAGTRALKPSRLLDHDVLWPDGRPHALVERSGHQAPFVPAMANARLVRADRRQFRVLEGGLSTAAAEAARDSE